MGKLESEVESEVRAWVEDQGGKWVKLLADGRRGIPDNLLIFPPLKIEGFLFPLHVIIELKRPVGGKLSPHQERWLRDLSGLEQPVAVCKSLEHVQDFVDYVKQSIRRRVLGPKADLR